MVEGAGAFNPDANEQTCRMSSTGWESNHTPIHWLLDPATVGWMLHKDESVDGAYSVQGCLASMPQIVNQIPQSQAKHRPSVKAHCA
jgi:hypothetical protein